ncbi:MAG: hypothetical protein IBX53_07340 [Halomonas sp.]|uniref:hypothetical protein n=1 Tax=Halomonas sp. TaxID=1486246 RepID=UPI0019F4A832|nr:hypothetical protein [Halomonas sp.]MBE0488878.1 hypothetical protein [Halomonas sp.]
MNTRAWLPRPMPALVDGRMQLLVPDVSRTSVRVLMLGEAGLVETDRCPLSEPITGPDALQECERRLSQAAPGTPEPAK